jgi:hypothetical protein
MGCALRFEGRLYKNRAEYQKQKDKQKQKGAYYVGVQSNVKG